ncbi:MAG: hypothetical protein IT389_04115 [Nitrospira sp.]|nr:hypothetical protein [Nitrospira sp.]
MPDPAECLPCLTLLSASDAFEVALLEASTMTPLAGVTTGLKLTFTAVALSAG